MLIGPCFCEQWINTSCGSTNGNPRCVAGCGGLVAGETGDPSAGERRRHDEGGPGRGREGGGGRGSTGGPRDQSKTHLKRTAVRVSDDPLHGMREEKRI